MVIVITGPTCVGKTKLSIELAKRFNGEIINADSTQIYRGLDIATAKIKESEKENIKHYLFDIKDIEEDYTVYDYQLDCRNTIDLLLNSNKVPILVGGTGLYIKSALYDYKFGEENKYNYDNLTDKELYGLVKMKDPSNKIHANNRKRLERALNYMESTNLKFSEKETTDKLLYDAVFIGLTTDRENLYDRINNRVDNMMKEGLLEEAKKVYQSNVRTKAVLTPIGYKELFPYFEKKDTIDNCINKIKQSSRHYAKRQYTWFNNQMNVKWFNVDFNNFNNTVDEVYNYILTGFCNSNSTILEPYTNE